MIDIYNTTKMFLSTLWTFCFNQCCKDEKDEAALAKADSILGLAISEVVAILGFDSESRNPNKTPLSILVKVKDRYVFVQHRFEQENASGMMPKTAPPVAPAFRFKSCVSSFWFLLGIRWQSIRFGTWPINWPWLYQADRKKKKKNKTLDLARFL